MDRKDSSAESKVVTSPIVSKEDNSSINKGFPELNDDESQEHISGDQGTFVMKEPSDKEE